MSSKQRRTTRTREAHHETTGSSEDSLNGSTSSTQGGAKWSRLQEKEQLSHLNDRLAGYIERVRNLENENNRLQVQIKDVEIIERKEKDNLAARYESKIGDLRKLVDDLSRDKARLEIERSKAVEGYNDLKTRVGKLEKEAKRAEDDRAAAVAEANDLRARYTNANDRRNALEKENKSLKTEVDDLQKQLDVLRRQLEDEVILRTELENKLTTYKEDLEFSKRSHEAQLDDFRRKRQVEMTTVSRDLEQNYQAKLQDQLKAIRADFDARIAENRRELDDLYKKKMSETEDTLARSRDTVNESRSQAARYRQRINELETENSGFQGRLDALNARVADLENQLRRERDVNDHKLQQRDERIAELEKEISDMISDYRDLMDLKIQLDTELQAYQKLLEGEETRLNISIQSPDSPHVSFADLTSSGRRGVKRKRLDQEDRVGFDHSAKHFKSNSHSDLDIVIEDVDTEGRSITLANKSDENFAIGSWAVKSVAADKEVIFKFNSRQVIKPGKTITVWSADSGETHSPPDSIVMKNQTWPSGSAIRVELLNEEKETVAWKEYTLEHGFRRIDSDADPDQRCSIM
ncbi:intermediate filament tail domain-containing protein [Aphelenchoides avenae]|nr:intermediate filament tail domain-containing protein [Aphelenchus avenae]